MVWYGGHKVLYLLYFHPQVRLLLWVDILFFICIMRNTSKLYNRYDPLSSSCFLRGCALSCLLMKGRSPGRGRDVCVVFFSSRDEGGGRFVTGLMWREQGDLCGRLFDLTTIFGELVDKLKDLGDSIVKIFWDLFTDFEFVERSCEGDIA